MMHDWSRIEKTADNEKKLDEPWTGVTVFFDKHGDEGKEAD